MLVLPFRQRQTFSNCCLPATVPTVPKKSAKQRVIERDEQGRPTAVDFSGDPAQQCPACLSDRVEPWGAIGFLPSGNELIVGDTAFSPIRRMRCLDCGARYIRVGV